MKIHRPLTFRSGINPLKKSRTKRNQRRNRLELESLEDRLALSTARDVENILLPEFMAQLADPNGNQLGASDAWWALRSQRNMAIDEPISKVSNLAAHNAFNSLNEGFFIVPFVAPNQILSLSGQLEVGARAIELDIHDPVVLDVDTLELTRRLVLKHGPPPSILTRPVAYLLENALTEVRAWLDRPENLNEVIYLDFEDSTEQNENSADEQLLPLLLEHFDSMIYTPADRAGDNAWPSRAELVKEGKRVIIFSHRNDEFHGRFGVPNAFTDPNGHTWFGSRLAFRANGAEDPVSDRGNYHQVPIDDFDFMLGPGEDPPFTPEEIAQLEQLCGCSIPDFTPSPPPENADFFFSVQSDGLRNNTAHRYDTDDVAKAARLNVDFMKMDFLFGDDEDADLGLNGSPFGDPTFDPFYDIPEDNRIALLEAAVWSWKKHDPAVDRQMFQDLRPGDGTGAAMLNRLTDRITALGDRLDPGTMETLAIIGAVARSNGRDVAVQRDGRWVSTEPTSSTAMRFAARSVEPNADGEYQWLITSGASTNWFDGGGIVQSEFGNGFVFHGPVNGFQNFQLANAASGNDVWINVHDFDHDGNWQVGKRAPSITSLDVQPSVINEGESVQLAVAYTFDGGASMLRVDWGDGTPPTTLPITAQSSNVIASHIYRDDDPSVTGADNYEIQVTLTDASGDADSAATQVTVRNVAPTIGTFTSDATFANPAAEGKAINILTSFADPGVRDSHIANINWGDGNTSQGQIVLSATGIGSVAASHAYRAGGVYTIALTLADDDQGIATATATAVVTGVGLNNETLYIVGGRNDDDARVHPSGSGRLTVRADFIGDRSRTFDTAAVRRIIAYLGDGDDRLDIELNQMIPVVAHGGAGNDRLESDSGPSVLLGDAGNDQLSGRGGRNILIGGTGYDSLFGGSSGDVLIGGRTVSDQDDMTLLEVLAAWNASSTYAARVALINALLTVIDDHDRDRLKGGAKLDLFYLGEFDVLADVKNDEIVVR